MHTTCLRLAPLLLVTGLLAACEAPASRTDRAIIGAGMGAIAGEVIDDAPVTGAVVGGAAGYFCDDLGICRPRR